MYKGESLVNENVQRPRLILFVIVPCKQFTINEVAAAATSFDKVRSMPV